jgi:hypothetical protein
MNVKRSFEFLRDFTWLTEMTAIGDQVDALLFRQPKLADGTCKTSKGSVQEQS